MPGMTQNYDHGPRSAATSSFGLRDHAQATEVSLRHLPRRGVLHAHSGPTCLALIALDHKASQRRESRNPPERWSLGNGTKSEGYGSARIWTRYHQMGLVVAGSYPWGRKWRTAAALRGIGSAVWSRKPSRTVLARVCGDLGLSGGQVSRSAAGTLGGDRLAAGLESWPESGLGLVSGYTWGHQA